MNKLYPILNKVIQYGTLIFVFLIPWQARLILVPGSINGNYWEYGTNSLYATEVLLFVILIALIVKGILVIKKNKPNFSARNLIGPVGMLGIFVVWAGLSIIWANNSSIALEHWIVLVEASVIFLVISSKAVPFYKLSWAIILSGVAQSVLAFIQFKFNWLPGSTLLGTAYQDAMILGTSVVETDLGRYLRGYGTFPHPNMLAGWLVLSLILAIQKIKTSQFVYASIALLSVGLSVTFSRGAWLAIVLVLVIYAIHLFVRKIELKKFAQMVIIIIVFVGAVVASNPDPFVGRITGENRLEQKSNQERVVGNTQAWEVIKNNRILGTGIGNYGLGVYKYIDSTQPSYYYQPVHNVFLLVWAELGVVGLLFVIAFLLMLFNFVYLGVNNRIDIIQPLIFIIPIVVISFFDHYVWSLYSGLMIGMLYMAIFYLKLAKKEDKCGKIVENKS